MAINGGNLVTVRVIEDEGVKSGDYPAIYFDGIYDFEKKNVDEEKWEDNSGNPIPYHPNSLINIFSVKKSIPASLNGFDNIQGQREVRAGGGFRIQLDDIDTKNPSSKFTNIFLFDDIGPRNTSLNTEFSLSVPRVSLDTTIHTESGKFAPEKRQENLNEILETGDAKTLVRYVIDQLFKDHSASLYDLFYSLMEIFPRMKQHSIEGIFNIQDGLNGPVLSIKVIDFDGIDSSRAEHDSEIHRLKMAFDGARFNLMRVEENSRFLNTKALLSLDKMDGRIPVKNKSNDLLGSGEILSLYHQLIGVSYSDFVRIHDLPENRLSVQIGKILKLIGKGESVCKFPNKFIYHVEITGNKQEKITGNFFSIAGEPFGIAYINDQIITDPKQLIKILGFPIAVYESIKEGD